MSVQPDLFTHQSYPSLARQPRRRIISQAEAPAYIANHWSFVASSLRGIRGPSAQVGELPLPFWREYHRIEDIVVYTVLSYNTPIAWVDAEGWTYLPPLWYSMATTRHQSIARRGLGAPDVPPGGRWVWPRASGAPQPGA